jgi:HEAT repeat protein
VSPDPSDEDAFERAAHFAELGHRDRVTRRERRRIAAAADHDPDARVRATAMAALTRVGRPRPTARAWRRALADPDAGVRRRALELAPSAPGRGIARRVIARLGDPDPLVAETAAAALGELGAAAITAGAVPALAVEARHGDPLVREAAVAALGALGDPAGRDAVLAACADRPAVRRRAVMALAAFSGPEVEAALDAARHDRDWQTRQAAEDLLAE